MFCLANNPFTIFTQALLVFLFFLLGATSITNLSRKTSKCGFQFHPPTRLLKLQLCSNIFLLKNILHRYYRKQNNCKTYYIILYYTILYYTILYYTILYYIILYYTILYYTVLHYTSLYYTILYYTTLYYTILYMALTYYYPMITFFHQNKYYNQNNKIFHLVSHMALPQAAHWSVRRSLRVLFQEVLVSMHNFEQRTTLK